MEFLCAGDNTGSEIARGIERALRRHGHTDAAEASNAGIVIHTPGPDKLKPYRRHGRGTFVITIIERPQGGSIQDLYPLLVRTLSNLLIVVVQRTHPVRLQLVTPEMGHVKLENASPGDAFFDDIYTRIEPLATSTLVIDNDFTSDLPHGLRDGDEHTAAIARTGRALAALKLLPSPIRLHELLSEEDLRFLRKAYSIGGLSAGNFSERLDASCFWMSASGVDKSQLKDVGRDMMLVTGYDAGRHAMCVSVSPDIEPRRVSMDAIEHWMIYHENPGVGAVLHVHAWIEGVTSTELQYPCGTYELARAVSDVVRASPDPNNAVVGLKNHGLTITGPSLDEILACHGDRLVSDIPMI